MRRLLAVSFTILLSFRLASAAPSADASSEADAKEVNTLIRTSVNAVLKILKDEGIDKEDKKREVLKVIDPVFDFRLMAKLVLGRRHWPQFGKKQRQAFTDLFIKTLQDSYFDKVDLLTDEEVEFDKPVRKKKKYTVLTHIISKDERYKMLYKLYRKQGSWRVYDVELEGISIVKSYGSQYSQFLEKGSPQELIVKMREKAIAAPKDLEARQKEIKEKAKQKERKSKKRSNKKNG